MTEKWEEGCDHHCGCVFVLLALADKLAEMLRKHTHGGTDCGRCEEALNEHEAALSNGSGASKEKVWDTVEYDTRHGYRPE